MCAEDINGGEGKGDKKRQRRRRRNPSAPRRMRRCQFPSCGEAFYPTKPWQKFCGTRCADSDRHRRQRERYRELMDSHGEDIARTEQAVKEAKEARKAERKARYQSRPVRNRSPEQGVQPEPEPDPSGPPGPRHPNEPVRVLLTGRVKDMRMVHPRSLENLED